MAATSNGNSSNYCSKKSANIAAEAAIVMTTMAKASSVVRKWQN